VQTTHIINIQRSHEVTSSYFLSAIDSDHTELGEAYLFVLRFISIFFCKITRTIFKQNLHCGIFFFYKMLALKFKKTQTVGVKWKSPCNRNYMDYIF